MTENQSSINQSSTKWCWVAFAIYALARCLLLPAEQAQSEYFSHDSAYITIVANNLLAGKGFVNDAHFLVFLMPEELPMPYHNANPLYPTLVAATSFLTGLDTATSGFAINALFHVGLWIGLFVLVGYYESSPIKRFFISAGGVFFPVVFKDSLNVLPDSQATMFVVWALVFLLRPPKGNTLVAGLLLGLAWLTRSSVVLLAPAIVVLWWMRFGWKQTVVDGAKTAAVVVLVASCWLIHTWVVWGNPLRSDSSYYLLQDYHAQNYDNDVLRYWHSVEEPAGLRSVLLEEGQTFLAFTLRGIPVLGYNIIAKWTDYQELFALLLVMLGLAAFVMLVTSYRSRNRADCEARTLLPEMSALVTYGLTTVAIFSIRAASVEIRYLAVLSVFFGIVVTVPGVQSCENLLKRKHLVLSGLTFLCFIAFWLGFAARKDITFLQSSFAKDERSANYFELTKAVQADVEGEDPIVVGSSPYYYTLFTNRRSLSFPQANDDFLRGYMDRYGVRYVFLTRKELEFWRPEWVAANGPPSWLTVVKESEDFVVYKRREDG